MTDYEYDIEIKRLVAKYSKFGATEKSIRSMTEAYMPDADPNRLLDLESRLTATKIILQHRFSEAGDEFLSVKEIAHTLGMSEDEVLAKMESAGLTPTTISFGIQFE